MLACVHFKNCSIPMLLAHASGYACHSFFLFFFCRLLFNFRFKRYSQYSHCVGIYLLQIPLLVVLFTFLNFRLKPYFKLVPTYFAVKFTLGICSLWLIHASFYVVYLIVFGNHNSICAWISFWNFAWDLRP